jgi:DNA-binding SARP family transcriptional activator/ATP/maltotriose-dependent transcriptional regulator MalT
VSVQRAGKPVYVAGTRQRAVLALLLLHANEALSVGRIVEEVWGPNPPETATKMLRNTVSQLRRLLADELLVTHPGGYALAVDPDRIDSRRFERLVREGRTALSAGEVDVAAAILAEGLALWRGAALADVIDVPFAATETTRLEQMRLTAIEDRVEADLGRGRHAELVGELEALVAQYPLRERLRGQLMLALYRAGRQVEALEAYQKTRRLLVDELGIEPGRDLQRLERAILVQDSALDLEPARAPAERAPAAESVPTEMREVRKTVSAVIAEVVPIAPGRDPEALRRPMTRALEVVRRALERHGAWVDQLIAGAVMGVFGVPVLHEDDAMRAVRAAVGIREDVAALAEELEREWALRVVVRAGVATGEVVVAGAGDAHELVAGDAVERAARLQQAAAAGQILIGNRTKQVVDEAARVKPVELPALDAQSLPSRAWNLVELAPVTAVPGRHPRAPMVGREHELTELAQAFARTVREGRSYLFTVLGAAGIGKSRLAAEFADSIAADATILTGRCPPYGEAIAFWPLAEMVRQLSDGDVESAIAAAVAGEDDGALIAERVGSAIGLVEAGAATEETFWAVRKLFEAVARRRPLVLVFEDVHWAEPTLLELVEHVAEYARDAPILLVCLSRPELLETRPSWAGGKLNATTILLDPLSDDESARLLEHLVGASAMRADALARVREIAEGNPLFLEEMLAMLSEQADADVALAVPPTIKAVLAARLDRLPAHERAALEAASVIGKEFWRSAVVELSPDAVGATVAHDLDALVRRELIWPHRSLFQGDDAFRFHHILLREAAYESVPKERRAELHERAADWLERAAGARLREFEESVGHHLAQAHRYLTELAPPDQRTRTLARRAAERLAAAGRRAYARGDLPAAARLLSRAAEVLEPGVPERVELLIDLGDALRESGDMGAAEAALREAAAAVRSTGDEVLEAHVVIARLRLQLQTDPEVKTEEVMRAAEGPVRLFEQVGDDRRLAKAWELLGWVPWFRCRAAAAEEAWLRALEYARRARDSRTEAQSLNMLVGAVWFGPTPVRDGIRRYEEILARPAEQRRIRASVLRALAGLKAMEGDFEQARGAMADSRAILEDLGLHVTAASAAETAAIIELLAGDPAAAEHELRMSSRRLEEMGDTTVTPVLAALLAQALYAQERDSEALAFTEVSEAAATADDLSAHVQWRAARAKVLARLGRLGEAEALAREAVALAEQTDFLVVHADALVDLAEVLRAGARAEEAGAVLRDAVRLYERKGNRVAARRARRALTEKRPATRLHADR